VWLARLGLGAVLSMLVMSIAWVEYLDPAAATSEEYRRFAPWAMLFAATPVFLMLGVPYLYGAVRDLARGRVGADLLIGIGILAAYAASVVAILTGRPGATWLDTAAGLATLVSVGRWLEATAKERAARRLREFLSDAERPAARLAPGHGLADPGEPEAVRASDLRVGDRVLVRPGGKVPSDGRVLEGRALVDEAALSGEPLPRSVGPGDALSAPVVATDGPLVLEVTAVGGGTRLGEVAAVLARARAERSPVERLADRVSAVFVPGVVLLAGAVLALDLGRGDPLADAALRALSVLVIACPCALAIATPLAVTAALGRLAERGVLVRTGMALAGLPRVRAVAFDKTGTLTEGRPDVRDVRAREGRDPAHALALAAAVEAASEHALGRAIALAARARGSPALAAQDVRVVPGRGVEGVVLAPGRAPVRVRVGSPAWLGALAGDGVPAARAHGAGRETEVGVEADGVVVATIRLEDRLRADAAATVAALAATGHRVVVLSGDSPAATRAAALALGLPAEAGVGGCLPADKVEAIRRLRAEAKGPVAFVGDGLNDAPALAAADLGLAVGSGTDLARETADVSLLGDDLSRLPGLFRAARRTRSAARWNLFWAFAYNVVGIGIAVATRLEPVFAAFAMVASSLFVIANSARLRATLPWDLVPAPAAAGGRVGPGRARTPAGSRVGTDASVH
jgi:heavy metal translocating P-type ATPase